MSNPVNTWVEPCDDPWNSNFKGRKIELIICFNDGTWTAERFTTIPESLWEAGKADDISAWVIDNDWETIRSHEVSYIGVYNWME